MTAKREAANKQALEVFRDAEKEAEQKYQAKLRQYDERESKNRTQEEAAISKAEAAIAKATAQLAAATEALSALDTTRDEKNEAARRARDKANAKAIALRDTTLAATEAAFQDKLEKATSARDEALQSDVVRDLQAQVCALDGEMAKELSFSVNRKNYQKYSDDSDSSDDDQPVRSLLTKTGSRQQPENQPSKRSEASSSGAVSDTEDTDSALKTQVCVADGTYEQPRVDAPSSLVFEGESIADIFNEWKPEACPVDRCFATEAPTLGAKDDA